MRLLFDNNLSDRLPAILSAEYPGSVHVRHVGLQSADDSEIWDYAVQHGLAIASKVSDFQQRSLLYGHPPKFLWLPVGNCSTAQIVAVLRRYHADLITFDADSSASALVVS
jgi:predicted nuclease of predicted toxin-antitoxin system